MSSIFAEMEDQEYLRKLKENILKRTETDRIMWFSMWFLASIATFGLALFLMVYLLIERRNKHFQRQKELENLVLSALKSREISIEIKPTDFNYRNALLWALSIVLVAPIFVIAYFLSKDLILHEHKQTTLFRKILPDEEVAEQGIHLNLYLMITLATVGVGVVYWLYRIFNDYNNHFKQQWRIEDRLVELLEKGELHGPESST